MRRWTCLLALLLPAFPLAAKAQPVGAQPASWGDCTGRVLVLGTHIQAEGALFTHWATLSNPGMRPIRVAMRWGEGAAGAPQRLESGRMLRLRLGEGAARLSPEEIAAQLRLLCQPIATQP